MRTELQTLKNTSVLALVTFAALASAAPPQLPNSIVPGPKPADVPLEWKWTVRYAYRRAAAQQVEHGQNRKRHETDD